MTDLVVEVVKVDPRVLLGPVIVAQTPVRPEKGNGFLSSSFPDNVTRLDGVPHKMEVRVLYRPKSWAVADGIVVAITNSSDSGQWRVNNLNPQYKYDVVFRYTGYKDEIVSDVTPFVE